MKSGVDNKKGFRLVCFDLDGTLVDDTIFIWHTLHDFFGTCPERRKELAAKFFSGKIPYDEWARQEIEEWISKGADRGSMMKGISGLKLMKGAAETLSELKRRGYMLAIISGSLSIVLERCIPDYEKIFDDVLINWICFDGKGKIKSMRFTEYDMERKADGLKMIAERHGINPRECVFVGDHENDIQVAGLAGFSISFNSKSERLNEVADTVILKKDLREILSYL